MEGRHRPEAGDQSEKGSGDRCLERDQIESLADPTRSGNGTRGQPGREVQVGGGGHQGGDEVASEDSGEAVDCDMVARGFKSDWKDGLEGRQEAGGTGDPEGVRGGAADVESSKFAEGKEG